MEPGHTSVYYTKALKDGGAVDVCLPAILDDPSTSTAIAIANSSGIVDCSGTEDEVEIVVFQAVTHGAVLNSLSVPAAVPFSAPPIAVPVAEESVTTSGTDSDSSGPVEDVSGGFRNEMPYGNYIEGCLISVDDYQDHGHNYIRWRIKCPLANTAHKVVGKRLCEKGRNVGIEQTKHMGIAEVYSYLGLWARDCKNYRCRKSHIEDFKPKVAELRAYAQEKGFL